MHAYVFLRSREIWNTKNMYTKILIRGVKFQNLISIAPTKIILGKTSPTTFHFIQKSLWERRYDNHPVICDNEV